MVKCLHCWVNKLINVTDLPVCTFFFGGELAIEIPPLTGSKRPFCFCSVAVSVSAVVCSFSFVLLSPQAGISQLH